ncbi:MAG: S1/P1 nuclease [Acidobacteriaceae bacterium]|nr:S1/P1 nuclease [Acidobacteriaceae bacterium]
MRFSALARVASVSAVALIAAFPANAWGPDGHEMINRLATQNLPAEVPAFVRDGSGTKVIEYLGPEPDRWRNKAESELASTQAADHFIDLEMADLVGPLPRKRFDFLRALATAQAAHPDLKLTPEKVGLQPWQVEEIWQRLKVDFREYRALKAAQKDTTGVEVAILFDCGWLGHYVGDGSQPLHTSVQYNGWVGANPNGYTTGHKIHWQFENDFVISAANKDEVAALVKASKPTLVDDEWTQYLNYLRHTTTQAEEVYQFEKAGALTGKGTEASRAFVDQCLANGAIELRDLIYTAWVRSADPVEEFKG